MASKRSPRRPRFVSTVHKPQGVIQPRVQARCLAEIETGFIAESLFPHMKLRRWAPLGETVARTPVMVL